MFKKIELWVVLLICIVFFVVLIFYGAVLRDQIIWKKNRFGVLSKLSVEIAEIPRNSRMLFSLFKDSGADLKISKNEHNEKPSFKRFISNDRNELLLLSRYDGEIKKSIVEIINLNDFKVIHTYSPAIEEIILKTDKSKEEFKRFKINGSPNRFQMIHPLILSNGDLIFKHTDSPLIKINFCGKISWINDQDPFHHSLEIDEDGNFWVPTRMYPLSRGAQQYKKGDKFYDDAITKVSPEGKILYQKSLTEILLKASLLHERDFTHTDPFHLNDIQPVLEDGKFWKKGDVFLSLRNSSMIILYRPSTSEVIKIIKGPFYAQHDVDIISKNKISIFNNNVQYTLDGIKTFFTEILIYDFNTEKFSKKFNDSLINNKVLTGSNGLNDFLNDGSLMVEQTDHGRILFFNSVGELEWEYLNKASNDEIYWLNWSRIINNKELISKIKDLSINSKCKN